MLQGKTSNLIVEKIKGGNRGESYAECRLQREASHLQFLSLVIQNFLLWNILDLSDLGHF